MTLASHRDQTRALGLPETSRPVLLNGWIDDEPLAVWRSGDEVRIAGTVKHGPSGTAAFELDEDQRPTVDQSFADVVVSAAGEVVVNGGPDAQVIEAAFSASREPRDREPSPT